MVYLTLYLSRGTDYGKTTLFGLIKSEIPFIAMNLVSIVVSNFEISLFGDVFVRQTEDVLTIEPFSM